MNKLSGLLFYAGLVKGFKGLIYEHYSIKNPLPVKLSLQAGKGFANAIGNLKDTHLSDFFRKILYRKGRTAAVSATARRLAVIIWNMIVKKQPYNPPTQYLFLDQKRKWDC